VCGNSRSHAERRCFLGLAEHSSRVSEEPPEEMRATVYRIAVDSGASDLAAWLMRRRATILTYHGLTARVPDPSRRPLYKLMVTEEAFREQMQLLRARYTVVGLEQLTTPERLSARSIQNSSISPQ